jgi:DNA-binding SARP family transcriptional activator
VGGRRRRRGGLRVPPATPEQAGRIAETIGLFQGEFLEGWYQEWCLYERERLQQTYFGLIDRMMAFCEAHREYETGLALGRRLLRQEPARECTHRRMMRLYDMSGDRCSAIRQFERCVEALREELGVRPSRLTLDLYEGIRTAHGGSPAPPAGETSRPGTLSLPNLLDDLRQVRTVIEYIETQVRLEIQTLKGAASRSTAGGAADRPAVARETLRGTVRQTRME